MPSQEAAQAKGVILHQAKNALWLYGFVRSGFTLFFDFAIWDKIKILFGSSGGIISQGDTGSNHSVFLGFTIGLILNSPIRWVPQDC